VRRLDLATLAQLPRAIERPTFDPARLGLGSVHLGIGAFHRAHQAVYTDNALRAQRGEWGICGVSLRSPDVRDRLSPQDGLYTVVEKSPERVTRRVVGSVREILFLGDQYEQVAARLADARIRIVSLTITEKGYCHDPATGELNFAHPDIAHDLRESKPVSAVGLITAALAARRKQSDRGFTVVCCDNLPHNGSLLRGLVLSFAGAVEPALANWIGDNARFPSTMVDRIVPATTPSDIADSDRTLGVHDAATVVCEPFIQWVLEDSFLDDRPAWERAGAQFVADVAPFEAMKLRLLNASHSAFAYLGFLAGHDFIFQVAAVPAFVAFMRRMMADEVGPSLKLPRGIDVAEYQNALVTRFANPALPHRTQQIAMDGSQKLPQRILATVRDNVAAGRPVRLLSLAVAGWMRYVGGVDEAGRPIAVSDPLAAEFARISALSGNDPGQLARGLFGLKAVFGDDLPRSAHFVEQVQAWLDLLFTDGAARTVARAVGGDAWTSDAWTSDA
jgi:fructuronate reductase